MHLKLTMICRDSYFCLYLSVWAKWNCKWFFFNFHLSVRTMFNSLVYKTVTVQSKFSRHICDSSIVLLASLLLAQAQNYLKHQCHTMELFELDLSLIINKQKQTPNILNQCDFQCLQVNRNRQGNGNMNHHLHFFNF